MAAWRTVGYAAVLWYITTVERARLLKSAKLLIWAIAHAQAAVAPPPPLPPRAGCRLPSRWPLLRLFPLPPLLPRVALAWSLAGVVGKRPDAPPARNTHRRTDVCEVKEAGCGHHGRSGLRARDFSVGIHHPAGIMGTAAAAAADAVFHWYPQRSQTTIRRNMIPIDIVYLEVP